MKFSLSLWWWQCLRWWRYSIKQSVQDASDEVRRIKLYIFMYRVWKPLKFSVPLQNLSNFVKLWSFKKVSKMLFLTLSSIDRQMREVADALQSFEINLRWRLKLVWLIPTVLSNDAKTSLASKLLIFWPNKVRISANKTGVSLIFTKPSPDLNVSFL